MNGLRRMVWVPSLHMNLFAWHLNTTRWVEIERENKGWNCPAEEFPSFIQTLADKFCAVSPDIAQSVDMLAIADESNATLIAQRWSPRGVQRRITPVAETQSLLRGWSQIGFRKHGTALQSFGFSSTLFRPSKRPCVLTRSTA